MVEDMKTRKMALPDKLLLQVQKPARYLGNEMHAVYKNREIPVRFAMCFPDVYEIGMSHLGIQILYELFNRRPDTWCERVFSPWTDMDRLLRENHIPLFALESQDPVRGFDFLGFTLQFELCYTNILQVLDLSGIPLDASARTDCDPIVIGGGPCACNPEPVARFFDMFYIGEGETSYDALLDLYREMKDRGESRAAFLRAAAQIPGIYVPSLYEVTYKEDGTIASFGPAKCTVGVEGENVPANAAAARGRACADGVSAVRAARGKARTESVGEAFAARKEIFTEDVPVCGETEKEIPSRIRRQAAADLDNPEKAPYPTKPLIPFITVTQDRVAVELQRGCIRGCRFCQAGMIYRPNRERKLSTVCAYADAMLDSTGQDDILLSSLSSSDYSCIHEIVDYISDRREADRVKLQVPSLRIDAFSLDLMARVQDVRKSSLTFAPEAGSQRLRDVINKGITEEEILKGAREAFRGGWNKVKLYFMLGLPTETEADRVAISDLANKISAAYYEEVPKEKRNGRCQITVSTSFFVPKPFTPFQWAPMYHAGDYLGFAATVNHAIYAAHNHRSIRYSWHDAQMIYLEGVLARGDRRAADLILEAYRLGAAFDCWLETWDYSRWEMAAANIGMDMDFYALREREKDEILPWDFIDIGVRRDFLWSEWEKAQRAELTPNCREACSGCGAASYGCGVCLREQGLPVSQGLYANPGTGSRAEDAPAGNPENRQKDLWEGKPEDTSEEKLMETSEEKPGETSEEKLMDTSEEKLMETPEELLTEASEEKQEDLCVRIRMRLAKYGPMKFIGHLELMRFLQKCLRRTDIDVHYSDGITPRMIMSTAMPLGLGLESSGEYVDIEIGKPVTTEHALEQLRPLMPEGLEVLDFRQVGEAVPEGGGTARKPEKAMSVVAAAEYEVRFRDSYTPPEGWEKILSDFVTQDEILWTKETKKGFRTLDMKPLIYAFSIKGEDYTTKESLSEKNNNSAESPDAHESSAKDTGSGAEKRICMCVCSRVGQNLRPEQLIGEAFRRKGHELPEEALQIRRVDLFAEHTPDGVCVRQGDRRQNHVESEQEMQRTFISLGEVGKII